MTQNLPTAPTTTTSAPRRAWLGAIATLAAVTGAGALALAPAPARAQAAYPSHAIELVVPFQPGGGTDALARSFADSARRFTNQSVIVGNKPGASGSLGWQDVMGSKPDGYRLAVITVELATLAHMGIGKVHAGDLQPIAQLNADPAAITVRAEAPWKTVQEFLAAARANPGGVSIGNAGPGSIWHLAASALEEKTGLKFNHVPFQGAGPGVLALLGGHVDALAVSPAEVSTNVQAGKFRMLAVMADKRVPAFPDVPTMKESGVDLSIGTWRGLAAPKGTPAPVVAYLQDLARKVSDEPAFRDTLNKQNLGFVYGDSDAFSKVISRDDAAFKTLIDRLGIRN